jgi:hypothetical protein
VEAPIGFSIFKLVFIFLKEKLETRDTGCGCFDLGFIIVRCIFKLSSLGLKLCFSTGAEAKEEAEAKD